MVKNNTAVVSDIFDYIAGVDINDVECLITDSPKIKASVSTWLDTYRIPVSIGDALSASVLRKIMDISNPKETLDFHSACKTEKGLYLPIPFTDSRWGRVKPEPDMYSSCQGLILDALLECDWRVISTTRSYLSRLERRLLIEKDKSIFSPPYPFLVDSSDTAIEYRKLSEILGQAHWCIMVASANDGEPSLIESARHAHEYALTSEYFSSYMTRFATPLYRMALLRWIDPGGIGSTAIDSDEILASLERLCIKQGMVEYQLNDKIDETAKSKSRSQRDQLHPWTYSTAYGIIVSRIFSLKNHDLQSNLADVLTKRLSSWPGLEENVMIKEFPTSFCNHPSAFSALIAIAALALYHS